MSNSLVSIIVPCYNQGRFLRDTLNSVLAQVYSNWECLIVNDGSTDDTGEIAKEYCSKNSRFIYIAKTNGGLSSARNAGLKKAKGDYIQFLDSDDLLQSEKISSQVAFLEKNPQVDITYSSSRYFKNDQTDLYALGVSGMVPSVDLDADDSAQLYALLYRNVCTVCSTLYRKKVFGFVPLFDEELKAFEDWFFHINCSLSGLKFHFYKEQNAHSLIRVHGESMMRQDDFMKQNNLLFHNKVFYLVKERLADMPWHIPTVYKKMIPISAPASGIGKVKNDVKYFLKNITK